MLNAQILCLCFFLFASVNEVCCAATNDRGSTHSYGSYFILLFTLYILLHSRKNCPTSISFKSHNRTVVLNKNAQIT